MPSLELVNRASGRPPGSLILRRNQGFSALRSDVIRPSPEYFSRYRRPNGNGDLPSEEEIDNILALAKKVMRRFFGFVKEMKRDLKTDQL